jgi:hypothetical protein
MRRARSNRLHFTPTSASWLNLVERRTKAADEILASVAKGH